MDTLPKWTNEFNAKKAYSTYIKDKWNTLLPISAYTESAPDDEPYERRFGGEDKAVFPHLTAAGIAHDPGLILSTPWVNTMTLDFARAVIEGE